MSDLRKYTTNQLIEELARRANERSTERPQQWCHHCKHYVPWLERRESQTGRECPDRFNPCTQGHTMQFVAPEDFDDEYGFYRTVCTDREPRA